MKIFFVKIKDYIINDCLCGIENLIKWFPIIWRDRNWDYHFIYVILKHKLHLTEKHIRGHNNHTSSEKDANQIKKCVLLLDRLIADDYHEMAFKEYDEKWVASELVTKKTERCEDCIEIPIVHTKEDKEKENIKNSFKYERYSKDQDKKMLFKLLNKNVEGWWE